EPKPVGELRDEIAEHVAGGGKAVQQEDRWRVLRPSLAIENSDAVDIHLPVHDRAHGKSFPHRSSTTSRIGCEQQTRTLPSAGLSSGSGPYTTAPETNPLSQLWQTPVRHDQRTGTSHASASSSRLPYPSAHATARLLRANEICGPSPAGPGGGCGDPVGVAAMPGVSEPRGPTVPVGLRGTRAALSAAATSARNAFGPHTYASASCGRPSPCSSSAERWPSESRTSPASGWLRHTWERPAGRLASSAADSV